MTISRKAATGAGIGIGCIVIIALLVIGVSLVIVPLLLMWAWNALAPLWGGPQIDFIHAFAAYLIIGIVGAAFHSTTK